MESIILVEVKVMKVFPFLAHTLAPREQRVGKENMAAM